VRITSGRAAAARVLVAQYALDVGYELANDARSAATTCERVVRGELNDPGRFGV
jgi:hypothetical protein